MTKRAFPAALAAALIASLALPAASGAQADAPRDELLERRWESLIAGGYEPLTIPVDWYDPLALVKGAPAPFAVPAADQSTIAPTALAAAAAWAEAQNSTALIVAVDGTPVFERYWQGSGRDTRFNPQSMSKTVTALLVGTAIARGEIASVDQPVETWLTEWRGQPRGRITLRQMLHMASGLEQGDAGMGYAISLDNPVVRHSLGSDNNALPLSLQPVGPAGERFDYNNQVNQLLGIILKRASGQDYETLLSERIWQKLGLADAAVPLDRPGGNAVTSCCILSRPIDWLRIGGLFLNDGMHDGEPIVPAGWIAAMTAPSPAYRGYGFQVWSGNQSIGGERPPGVPLVPWQSEAFVDPATVILHGHGGQRVYIVPSRRLVIVRAARQWPDAWDDALLPNLLARGTLTP
ncbi:serine hydrolase domain-containing protein [Paraurantiacibacter namhicola]|uniref:6-aminohexanoate-dimer hydrolase n=1 Tax=Paraurantiacibacter namhicola TaxID=645517 RepID=A0A1C7D4K4_9SPHN|nr:serine hydrolase [Paraurantiacibacter namhicola]ANU06379.1 6-aminohexanoate-dimer hydrolase [Paraurantiacibacter namhicola]